MTESVNNSKKFLIIYDGRPGSIIEGMAMRIAEGVRQGDAVAICQSVDATTINDFLHADGIILGSPCYFGAPSANLKTLLDLSYSIVGKLTGKVGGAFTCSDHIAGGNELTLRALLDFMLIHGMIIMGDAEGNPFGPVAINPTGLREDVVVDQDNGSLRLGQKLAKLAMRL